MTVNFAYLDQAWGESMIPKRKSKSSKQRSKYYDNIIDTYLGETQSGIDEPYNGNPAPSRASSYQPPHNFVPLTDYYVGQEYQSDSTTDYTPPSLQLSGERYQCPQNMATGVDETTTYMNYADSYKPLYPQSNRLTVEALPPRMVAAVPQEAPARVVQYPTIAQESQYIAPQYPLPQYTSLPSSPSSSAPPDISQQQMIEIGLFLAGGAILIMILEQFVQMGALLRGY
jgi:hypothetical protein